MAIMVIGFRHSGLVVGDLEKMVHFYRDILGLSILRQSESIAPPEGDHTGIQGAHRALVFVGIEDDEHALELIHYIDPPSPEGHLDRNQLGATHVCFNVEDLEKLHLRLVAEGIEFVTKPKFRDTPEGGRRGICYAKDPEGNWLEFIEGN